MNFGSGDYILTQSHPSRGIAGLVVDRAAYLATPYYDRALFEILNDHTEQYYYCKLEVQIGDKCSRYLIMDSDSIGKLLHEFNLYKYAYFITKELAKGCKASIQWDDVSFVFTLIKSN